MLIISGVWSGHCRSTMIIMSGGWSGHCRSTMLIISRVMVGAVIVGQQC